METLQRFISDETGLTSKVLPQKNWRELAERMAKGQLQLGLFEGYEFAWAQQKHPDLKPLAVAVNGHRYPVAVIVVKRDNPVKDFAALQGKSIFLPAAGPHHMRVFIQRQSETRGKKAEVFFSKVATKGNVEDALDDVVDGKLNAVAVDRTALEAYQRRKPGRAKRLKELARSQPFPPPVVAYFGTVPDEASRRRFRQGLLGAARKERAKMMLTFFRVTGFEDVPDDLGKVLAQTRKDYPLPVDRTK